MSHQDLLPQLWNGARLVVAQTQGRPLQVITKIVDVGVDGQLTITTALPSDMSGLEVGQVVTLEYFRRGVLVQWKGSVCSVSFGASDGPLRPASIHLNAPVEMLSYRNRRGLRVRACIPIRFAKFEAGLFRGRFEKSTLEKAKEIVIGEIRQVGTDGLGMVTPAMLDEGDELALGFAVEEQDELRFHGRVAWAAGADALGGDDGLGSAFGVEFVDANEVMRERLRLFIKAEARRRPTSASRYFWDKVTQ